MNPNIPLKLGFNNPKVFDLNEDNLEELENIQKGHFRSMHSSKGWTRSKDKKLSKYIKNYR